MRKYLILILEFLCLLFTTYSYGEPASNCTCYQRGGNQFYKYYWVGVCTQQSHFQAYPYYLISSSIKSKLIIDPSRYIEYYHNLHVFNDSLVNMLNYKLNECETWPNNYSSEGLRERLDKALTHNEKVDQSVREDFRRIYEKCHRLKHHNTATLRDHSFLEFIEGHADLAAKIAENYIQECKLQNIDPESSQDELLLLGESYLELAQYYKAIEVLSELIQKNPTYKEAYFHRSSAYFEIGNYDDALLDFTMSDRGKTILKSTFNPTKEFTAALMASVCQGAKESAVDFVPSLCSTAYGLNKTLWTVHWEANPLNPQFLENTSQFASACYEITECVVDYCKNVDWETIEGYVDQVKTLYERFDQLSESEKGELIGYTVGKYGTDLFLGGLAVKGISAYRNLRNANRLCNLEAMVASSANKEEIIISSAKHACEREAFLKNIKIHRDKQNKHIPGSHNFEVGRGTILIESYELEALVKEHAGEGQKVTGNFGQAGYKERVDFGKIIGEYAEQIKGEPTKYYPTSKGIITYAKDGSVHVYPTNPHSTFN